MIWFSTRLMLMDPSLGKLISRELFNLHFSLRVAAVAGATKELPEAILQEYEHQIQNAIVNEKQVRHLIDAKEIKGPFQKCCKQAVAGALRSLGTDHATTRKMQQEGSLPFDISGSSRTAIEKITKDVKEWAVDAFSPGHPTS